jgi:predicted nucleic acid-binding protein
MVRTLVDAGPLIAFWNRMDKHHDWAVECFRSIQSPAFTTEPVIAEACHFIINSGRSPGPLLEKVEAGVFEIPFQLSGQAGAIALLIDKYEGRMDLADATLVRLSELFDDSQVLTTDYADFSIYRRHGRQVIPLLAPPK